MNHVHVECMRLWVKARRQRGLDASCPCCRARWRGDAPGAAVVKEGKYLNLAGCSGAPPNDRSLYGLYGDRAVWIQARKGLISRRAAISRWRNMGHWRGAARR